MLTGLWIVEGHLGTVERTDTESQDLGLHLGSPICWARFLICGTWVLMPFSPIQRVGERIKEAKILQRGYGLVRSCPVLSIPSISGAARWSRRSREDRRVLEDPMFHTLRARSGWRALQRYEPCDPSLSHFNSPSLSFPIGVVDNHREFEDDIKARR